MYIYIYTVNMTQGGFPKKAAAALAHIQVRCLQRNSFVSVFFFCRYQEKPQRPWHIFKFDAFKNGFGACVVHFMNIFIAMQFAGKEDPCPWYLFLFSFYFPPSASFFTFLFFSFPPSTFCFWECLCELFWRGGVAAALHKH